MSNKVNDSEVHSESLGIALISSILSSQDIYLCLIRRPILGCLSCTNVVLYLRLQFSSYIQ